MSERVFPAILTAVLLSQTFLSAQSDDTAIEHKLSQELISIQLEAVPLEQAVYRIIGQFSQAIRVTWPNDLELQDSPLSLALDRQPMGAVLRQVLGTQKLDYLVQDGHLVVLRAKERRCVEIEESGARFLEKGVRVGMVLPKSDRCGSRAMVEVGGQPGIMVSEGIEIEPGVTVGLIQDTGVVFVFEGRCFDVRIPGADMHVQDSEDGEIVEVGPGSSRAGLPSPADEIAFDDLRLRVTGIIYDPDDPQASFAVINGAEFFVGDRMPGGSDAIVKEIRSNHVIFGFRGFDWAKYNGE